MKKGPCTIGGFTLIELLVVVAVIGIMVAIMMPNYQHYSSRGFNAAAESDLRNLKTSMESVYADNHTYPVF